MPTCLKASSKPTGSDWWDPSYLTTVGKPEQAKASMWRISSSIGAASKLAVPKGTAVRVGVWRENESQLSFLPRPASIVLCAAIVLDPRQPVACCTCVRRRLTRPCMRDDKNNRPQRFGSRMPREQGLKGRFRKQCVHWVCVEHAMMA